MIEIKFSTEAKKDCLKGGFPVDHLRKALKEELESKTMTSLTDELYISVLHGKRPIMAIGRQYDDLFIVEEVNFNTTLIFASEAGEPSIMHKPDYEESEEYLALKEIRDNWTLLDTTIDCLDLSVSTYNRLYKIGLIKIRDIIDKSEDYFRKNKILPPSNLAELKGRLLGLNLGFRETTD